MRESAAPHAEAIIAGYLARLDRAAERLPATARQELIEDIQGHIREARAALAEETDAEILSLIDHLGEPEELVEAALPGGRRATEAGDNPNYREPVTGAQPPAAGIEWLGVALVIAALFFLPPLGILLVLLYPGLNRWDKLVFGGVIAALVLAAVASSLPAGSGYSPNVFVLLFVIGLGGPILALAFAILAVVRRRATI